MEMLIVYSVWMSGYWGGENVCCKILQHTRLRQGQQHVHAGAERA